MSFDFRKYSYYFFTIKHNNSVTLGDNAHDISALILYVKWMMVQSIKLKSMLICFELDSKGGLHAHGIAEADGSLVYKRLKRDWCVHHKFTRIFRATDRWDELPYGSKIILYITKCPLPFVVKLFKQNNALIDTDILIYWDYKQLEELNKDAE